MKVKCYSCNKIADVRNVGSGGKYKCPYCGKFLKLPKAPSAPPMNPSSDSLDSYEEPSSVIQTCISCEQPLKKDEDVFCIECDKIANPKCNNCGRVCLYGETICRSCLPEPEPPTLAQKAVGIAIIAPVLTYFAATECVAKPAIRTAKKLLKGLGDWAER